MRCRWMASRRARSAAGGQALEPFELDLQWDDRMRLHPTMVEDGGDEQLRQFLGGLLFHQEEAAPAVAKRAAAACPKPTRRPPAGRIPDPWPPAARSPGAPPARPRARRWYRRPRSARTSAPGGPPAGPTGPAEGTAGGAAAAPRGVREIRGA